MKTIVGVRFRKPGKIYFFDPGNLQIKKQDKVVVETAMGQEIGEVVTSKKMIQEETLKSSLKRVVRIATQKDLKHDEENRKKEKEAFKICEEKIKKYKLDMNLTEVEYKFDDSKILFYFTAEGRIDFRELVKDLASIFRTRIELRQIGVRDEVRRIGGNGVCGRELCCCSFLGNFETVSIKMAKEQNISLNPSKISGNCGRLMCCLKYEEDIYEELNKNLPNVGDIITTVDGTGEILSTNVLMQTVKAAVRKKENDPPTINFYSLDEITVCKQKKVKKVKTVEEQYEQ